ncbi:hypothetical protein [Burkholderia cenocepacia]|uniref:DUF2188 domain-containing protein n=1 Tax=Burkholderia cenocepacia TaxID=95486 RepID=A0A3Q9FDT8_9BURK|nr:hypothetical protein [Burkholderia cenocepacia]AZQ55979.1 hypothetical protein D5R55_34820 [Burkholderia cenocepacia]
MDHDSFRVGDHEYRFNAVPLTDGGWTTSIVHIDHGKFPPNEQRVDGSKRFATEDDARAHAEVMAHDLAKRQLDETHE